jgi:hypothetical protein
MDLSDKIGEDNESGILLTSFQTFCNNIVKGNSTKRDSKKQRFLISFLSKILKHFDISFKDKEDQFENLQYLSSLFDHYSIMPQVLEIAMASALDRYQFLSNNLQLEPLINKLKSRQEKTSYKKTKKSNIYEEEKRNIIADIYRSEPSSSSSSASYFVFTGVGFEEKASEIDTLISCNINNDYIMNPEDLKWMECTFDELIDTSSCFTCDTRELDEGGNIGCHKKRKWTTS